MKKKKEKEEKNDRMIEHLRGQAIEFFSEDKKGKKGGTVKVSKAVIGQLMRQVASGDIPSWKMLFQLLTYGGEKDAKNNVEEQKQIEAAHIDRLVEELTEMLKKADYYQPEMKYHIEMLAGDLHILRKLRIELLTSEPVLHEISREGNDRLNAHPIYGMVMNQQSQVRQDLKMLFAPLLANPKQGGGESALETLMLSMNGD